MGESRSASAGQPQPHRHLHEPLSNARDHPSADSGVLSPVRFNQSERAKVVEVRSPMTASLVDDRQRGVSSREGLKESHQHRDDDSILRAAA